MRLYKICLFSSHSHTFTYWYTHKIQALKFPALFTEQFHSYFLLSSVKECWKVLKNAVCIKLFMHWALYHLCVVSFIQVQVWHYLHCHGRVAQMMYLKVHCNCCSCGREYLAISGKKALLEGNNDSIVMHVNFAKISKSAQQSTKNSKETKSPKWQMAIKSTSTRVLVLSHGCSLQHLQLKCCWSNWWCGVTKFQFNCLHAKPFRMVDGYSPQYALFLLFFMIIYTREHTQTVEARYLVIEKQNS